MHIHKLVKEPLILSYKVSGWRRAENSITMHPSINITHVSYCTFVLAQSSWLFLPFYCPLKEETRNWVWEQRSSVYQLLYYSNAVFNGHAKLPITMLIMPEGLTFTPKSSVQFQALLCEYKFKENSAQWV